MAEVIVEEAADGAKAGLIVHVARDDRRLSELEGQLRFFAPKVRVVPFPAWDTVPYDRVSPNAEIVAKRPRFRGSRMKQDLRSYARLLVDAGLVLGVCDWGYCVYREEHSACLGNATGPNPARREP